MILTTLAGEVEHPGKTLPAALFTAVGVMLLCYVAPLALAAGADPGWSCWEDGSLSTAAYRIGGTWLGGSVLVSSCLGNWGLFSSELLEDTYQLLGMAESGLAPRWFSERHARTGTPTRAILFQLLIIALLVGLDFSSIMCIDNFFSAAAAALEFAAALKLRHSCPRMNRPYRVPLSSTGLSALLVVPFAATLATLVITASESWLSFAICVGALLLGVLLALPFATPPSLAEMFARRAIATDDNYPLR